MVLLKRVKYRRVKMFSNKEWWSGIFCSMRSLLHVTYNSCVHLSHGCDMHMACTKNRMVLVYEWQQPYILIRDGRWRMYEQLNRYWSLLFMCYSYCFPGHQLNLWIIDSPSWWSSHHRKPDTTGSQGIVALRWRHNGCDGVSNHQPHDCVFNRLFRRRSKLRVIGLCAGNSPVPGEFPAQMSSDAENVSISWRHHGNTIFFRIPVSWKTRTDTIYNERWYAT